MKSIQVFLLILILATLVLVGYIIYLMSTGSYISPLCISGALLNLGIGQS